MSEPWLQAQFLLAAVLILDTAGPGCFPVPLRRWGLSTLLLIRMVFVSLQAGLLLGLETESVIGLALVTLLGWSLAVLRCGNRPVLYGWLRLEGLLWLGGLLAFPALQTLVCTLLSSGLPLLLACQICSRFSPPRRGRVRAGLGLLASLAALTPLLAVSHHLTVEPASEIAGWLAILWLLLLFGWKRVSRVEARSPLAAAILLESLPAPALANVGRHLGDSAWIPWSCARPLALSPIEQAALRQDIEDLLRLRLCVTLARIDPHRVGQQLTAWMTQKTPTRSGLTPSQEVAVLLMTLQPEVSAGVFKVLGPEFVQSITLEISKLAPISNAARSLVQQRFLESFPVAMPLSLEAAAGEFPQVVASVFQDYYRSAPSPRRQWPLGQQLSKLRRRLAPRPQPVALAVLVAVNLGLGWRIYQERLFRPLTSEQRVQAVLDGTLGAHRARALLVERDQVLHCTVVLDQLPEQIPQVEKLVRELFGAQGVQVTVVSHPLTGPGWWTPLGGLTVGALSLTLLYLRRRRQGRVVPAPAAPPVEVVCTKKPASHDKIYQLMTVEPVTVEVGRGLLSLVDPNVGAKLLETVSSIRRELALDRGVVLPGVRFRDNLKLKPNEYVILLHEIEAGRGEVQVNQWLACGTQEQLRGLRGIRTFTRQGGPATWISPEQRGDAERAGCQLCEPVSLVAEHLSALVNAAAADLLGIQEVQALLDALARTHPTVVAEVVPGRLDIVGLRQVLRELLRRRCSIRHLVTILETLADHTPQIHYPGQLVAIVQARLASMGR